MNLIECVGMIGIIGMSSCCGAIASEHGMGCAVLGALAGASFLPLILVAAVHIEPTFTGRPYWPPCGDCGGVVDTYERAFGTCLACCACGARYTRRGRQCLRVAADGATRPHRRWRPLRGWLDESAPAPGTAETPYRDPHSPADRGSRRNPNDRG